MAELFEVPADKTSLNILDAGAGSGLLSVALIERLQSIPQLQYINLVCYENDAQIIDLLKTNLKRVQQQSMIHLDYEIREENYILSQMLEYNSMIGADANPLKYDMVIGNPPYMKIAKDAAEAKAMPDVCYGTPNLYFLFASMECLTLFQMANWCILFLALGHQGHISKNFVKSF